MGIDRKRAQRLMRLMARKAIQRDATRHGRGRPRHRYWLTDNGLRMTGSNFSVLCTRSTRIVSFTQDNLAT